MYQSVCCRGSGVAGGEMEVKQGGSDFQSKGCSVYRSSSPLDVTCEGFLSSAP